MNELSIKIVMILFPGIITTMLLNKITEHKPWGNFKYSLFIVFYGVMSYFLLQTYYVIKLFCEVGCNNFDFQNVFILKVWSINSEIKEIPYAEILKASIAALIISFLISYAEHKDCISSILMKFGITNKYGDYSTNYQLLKLKRNEWIDITIWDKNLFIRGIVVSINENNDLCELCIKNAEVFLVNDSNIQSLYSVEYISISEKPTNLLISTTQTPTPTPTPTPTGG